MQKAADVRAFDLNIERILEDWEVYHALRELIANALDEQLLTNTKDIEIFKNKSGKWIVRDYGRGLRYVHLTQKENEEKLRDPHVIGKFGIGLKDALATFDRHKVKVEIRSKYDDITLGRSEKAGFKDIITLHAYVRPASNTDLVGTEVILEGLNEKDIEKAKNFFLKFSGEACIETTKFGNVLQKQEKTSRIYINGVRVAEEENFLFSYNITSLTYAIKKALNRERTNVGRSAYTERVKAILTSSSNKAVASLLADDLKNYDTGLLHDELKWIDVQEHAVKILNAEEKVLFLTPDDLIRAAMMVDEARNSGYRIVTIPSNLKSRIVGLMDIKGQPIRDMGQFSKKYNESFKFEFVDPKDLKLNEKKVFDLTDQIFDLIGGRPKIINDVKISQTMRKELGSFTEATGLWVPGNQTIIIKRSTLKRIEEYAGTLLHEVTHAISGAGDVSREFELELTNTSGIVCAKALDSHER